jgi:two-component system nitrogen regulation response regulator NtrX
MQKSILIVDDEKSICQSLGSILADEGYEILSAGSGEEALKIIEEEPPSLIILDIWLPGIDGIETLKVIKSLYPQMRVIMISGHGTIETAVKATKLGAFDFFEKPLSMEKVILVVNHVFELIQLEEENKLLKQKIGQDYELTGTSAPILELKEMISIVAPTNAWILIMGENGTGKELVARSIHKLSKRAYKPFVEVNCAAIPEDLIESELFGHEKGAFTGATEKKRGKFDLAHEGTLFLQEKKFERVGGNNLIPTDVRVLAATNKDLEQEMEAGRFRQDLYYRLNVIPLRVPPLRERKEDIPVLVNWFLKEFTLKERVEEKSISDDALAILMEHDWPGNVRELKNIIERLVIMIPRNEISAKDIPPLAENHQTPDLTVPWLASGSFRTAKTDFEKKYIMKKLQEFDGNISKTAEAIGIERSNLHRKIKKFGVDDLSK